MSHFVVLLSWNLQFLLDHLRNYLLHIRALGGRSSLEPSCSCNHKVIQQYPVPKHHEGLAYLPQLGDLFLKLMNL